MRISRFMSSSTSSSDGRMRASAASNESGVTSSARKSPLLSVSQTRPIGAVFFLGKLAASKMESDFSGSSDVSVSVPGVTIRETSRSIMPLAPGVLPFCSTITTLSP